MFDFSGACCYKNVTKQNLVDIEALLQAINILESHVKILVSSLTADDNFDEQQYV